MLEGIPPGPLVLFAVASNLAPGSNVVMADATGANSAIPSARKAFDRPTAGLPVVSSISLLR